MNLLKMNRIILLPLICIFIQHRSTNAYNNVIRWNTYVDSRQEIRYNWTIPDFSILEREIYQKSTQIPNEKEQTGQWRVELYPDGIMNTLKGFISLRFSLVNDGGGLEKAIVRFKASIIDNQQTEVGSREELKELIANSNKIEWIQFCLKDWVFRNELLVNDTLTIAIHISYYIKCSNHSTSLEPNVIKCDLFDDMGSLLEDPKYADVKLIANGKSYSAHRAILAVRSGLLARLFEDFDKKCDKKCKSIIMNVPDADAELMDEMLRYIYTGKCKILNQVAEKLLVAADKYELEGLKTLCSQSMCKELSVKNAANMLVLANKYRLDELKSRVVTFIVENPVQVFNTTEWESKVVSNNQLLNEICKLFAYRLATRLPL